MRKRFKAYCEDRKVEFEVFFPEFAMPSYFEASLAGRFNIAEFEALISELSHAIVLFPEAAGSYAETGYFSAIQEIAEKTILVLDSQWQGQDSFISLGPAKKFDGASKFSSIIQMPYSSPDFDSIIKRIGRVKFSRNLKSIDLKKFSDLSTYEKFCLIYKICDLLTIMTTDDLIFMLKSIFLRGFQTQKVKQLISILVGSKHIESVGSFGHFRVAREGNHLMKISSERRSEETALRAELAAAYSKCGREFTAVIEEKSVAN